MIPNFYRIDMTSTQFGNIMTKLSENNLYAAGQGITIDNQENVEKESLRISVNTLAFKTINGNSIFAIEPGEDIKIEPIPIDTLETKADAVKKLEEAKQYADDSKSSIVGNAPSEYQTLELIADYIASDKLTTTGFDNRITQVETKIEKNINDITTANENIEKNKGSISSLDTSLNEKISQLNTNISANTDNIGLINQEIDESINPSLENHTSRLGEIEAITDALGTTYVTLASADTINGYAKIGENGKINSSVLPSFVDDVLDGTYNNETQFTLLDGTVLGPQSPDLVGKIFVDTTTSKTYRWSGSKFINISTPIVIGTISGTAYDGALGAENAKNIAKQALTIKTNGENIILLTSRVETIEKNYTTVTNKLSAHDTQFGEIKGSINTNKDNISLNTTAISEHTKTLASHDTKFTTLESSISTNTTSIQESKEKIAAAEALISSNTANIDKKQPLLKDGDITRKLLEQDLKSDLSKAQTALQQDDLKGKKLYVGRLVNTTANSKMKLTQLYKYAFIILSGYFYGGNGAYMSVIVNTKELQNASISDTPQLILPIVCNENQIGSNIYNSYIIFTFDKHADDLMWKVNPNAESSGINKTQFGVTEIYGFGNGEILTPNDMVDEQQKTSDGDTPVKEEPVQTNEEAGV